jgi:outer membrane protein OmpA-like peptidoglycan-associated protein
MSRNILSDSVAVCFIFIAATFSCLAQAVNSQVIFDRELQPNGDTLLTERDFGDWWFGITGSGAYSLYFGKLSVEKKFSTVRQDILDFSSGDGITYQGGITADWQPNEQPWGIGIVLNAYDYRQSLTTAVTENLQSIREYRSGGNYNYIGIAPSIRYKLPVLGLHAIAGVNLDILINHKGTIEQVQELFGRNNHDIKETELHAKKLRFGGHLGIASDIFMGEISNTRVRLMPFVVADIGSNIAEVNGSVWYSVLLRGGVNIKVGFNKTKEQILPLDPTYVEPARAIAIIQEERGISIEVGKDTIQIADLSYLGSTISEEQRVAPPVVDVSERVPVTPEIRTPVPKIVTNQLKTFSYSTSTSTALSRELQTYLDGVVEFLKANPRARLQIEGHSDNTGTIQETQRISDDRAQQVVRYLMKKGISRGRLLASGLGSRKPKADNRTDVGKQQNRRVEIKVVP